MILRVDDSNFKFSNYFRNSNKLGFGYRFNTIDVFKRKINNNWVICFKISEYMETADKDIINKIKEIANKLNLNYEVLKYE